MRNASKHLDPLKAAYVAQGSEYKNFIQSIKDLDTVYADSLVTLTKKLKELVKTNLQKNTDVFKKVVNKYNN